MTHELELLIGSESGSHIRLTLTPPPFADDGGIPTIIEISDGPFYGSFGTHLFKRELDGFLPQMRSLYRMLDGTTHFKALEGTLTFELESAGGGHINVRGHAKDDPATGRSLNFDFVIDQTYLPNLIQELEIISEQ
jgi:hypothetical protein